MKTHETATPVKAFNRACINGQFVTPQGTQVVDLVNPTDNKVIPLAFFAWPHESPRRA
jgi:aldehyde dehydrogenase (NAD+)